MIRGPLGSCISQSAPIQPTPWRMIHIHGSIRAGGGPTEFLVAHPQANEALTVLLQNLKSSGQRPLTAGPAWADSGDLVFASRWGEPLYPEHGDGPHDQDDHRTQRSGPGRPGPTAVPRAPTECAPLARDYLAPGRGPQDFHVVAARLGHADPAVTLSGLLHVLREHDMGIGDVFAQAIRASVSKSVSKPRQLGLSITAFPLFGVVVRGGVEPPTFRFSGGRSYQLSYLTSAGPDRRLRTDARPSGPDGI